MPSARSRKVSAYAQKRILQSRYTSWVMNLTRVVLPLFLMFVSPVWAGVLSLRDMYGTLQSPNFPESYPKDVELQWNISVPDGYQIRLYFMQFDIEPSYLCEYDYVKVFSGAEELAVFCGRENTDTERVPADDVILSPGNMLSVAFRSDFSNEERYSGFEAHYSAVDIDECRDKIDEDLACDHFCHNYIGGFYCSCRYGHQLHSDNRTCKVECSDSMYTERFGLITSPDFPRPYPKSSDCLYQIKLDKGFSVTLDFDDTFDVEDHPDVVCPYDHIKIMAGERVSGPFCGGKSPGRIQTDSNIVSVLFHSDNSGENKGWKLSYTSAGSECLVPLLPPHSRADPVQSRYFFKEHITVTCDPGYSLRKDGDELDHYQIECGADGTWSSSVPVCKTIDCGPVDASLGEVVYNSSSNSTTFGSRILYGCKSSPGDYSAYMCNQSGLWITEDGTTLPPCQSDQQNATRTEPKRSRPTASAQPGACGEESQPFPSQQKRIVGGRTAFPGLFPWQVLLHVEDVSRVPIGHWFGSGALLSPSWVLTAAHVLRTPRRDLSVVPVSPEQVRATLGITDIRDNQLAVNRSVDRLILHPDFDPRNYDNDIALVKLSQDVTLNELVRPVCLPPARAQGQAPSPLPNTLGVVAGWGISMANASASASDLGVVSEVLQYVKLPVVAQEECEASYTSRSANYNITDNMFCAGFYEGGRDTCLGDSGGAFVIKDPHSGRWVVQGLVSWGGPEECGSRQVYGVYTRVANYANWLRATMDTECWS